MTFGSGSKLAVRNAYLCIGLSEVVLPPSQGIEV